METPVLAKVGRSCASNLHRFVGEHHKTRSPPAALSVPTKPVHMDVPDIDVMWTDIPDPHTPMGAHGVGEIGITGVGAAVANAVYNATGRRVRQLPIRLDQLL